MAEWRVGGWQEKLNNSAAIHRTVQIESPGKPEWDSCFTEGVKQKQKLQGNTKNMN